MRYEIRLEGRLPRNWTHWFAGFSCSVLETGETVLTGAVPDQAALVGLLSALTHLNVTLLSVRLQT